MTAPTGTALGTGRQTSQSQRAASRRGDGGSAASTPAPATSACKGALAGQGRKPPGFREVLTQLLQRGQWQTLNQQSGGSYHIYMGKYASQEQLEHKEQGNSSAWASTSRRCAIRPASSPASAWANMRGKTRPSGLWTRWNAKASRTAKVITITPAQVQWSFKMQGLSPDQAQQLKQRLGERNLRVRQPARA